MGPPFHERTTPPVPCLLRPARLPGGGGANVMPIQSAHLQPKRTVMKQLLSLGLTALLLAGCSTSTTSSVVTYDAEGREISTSTTSTQRSDTAEKAREIGGEIKDGVISGYEWTRDRTLEGYEWVKEKSSEAYDSMKK